MVKAMNYSLISDTYQKIEATSKRLEMTQHLVELIRNTPPNMIDKVTYLTVGEVYPPFVGIELGLADKLAIRAITHAAKETDEQVKNRYKVTGDLGKTAEELLKERPKLIQNPLTVEKVYDNFEKICQVTGKGAVEAKIELLVDLLNDATPIEAKYVIRTVLGVLRVGIGDMTILDALAIAYGGKKEFRKDLERAYNLSSDLGYVAKTVAEQGMDAIRCVKVYIGRPIRMMLAERLTTAKDILEKLNGEGAVEYKYDGLRVQAHLSQKEISLVSRRLENLTKQFPDISQALRESIQANEAIVEGECVAVDVNTGDLLPFQVVTQRRGRKYEIQRMIKEVPVIVFLFDVLYADGVDYTVKPYPNRRRALEKIVKRTDDVKVAEQFITSDPEQLENYMDQAISSGCEGVVVKSIGEDSFYKAGVRGWSWIKYKREYKSEMADTADLVVVGAFFGKGRRTGTYGALLMAAYDEDEDVFKTVSKLGTGFTDEDLANLPKIMEASVIDHPHPRVDSKIKPDIWFVPAIVLEVIGAELTLSPMHTCGLDSIRKGAGLAIRFPRFTGNWRKDKAPEDATTVKEIIEMYNSQLKKIKKSSSGEGKMIEISRSIREGAISYLKRQYKAVGVVAIVLFFASNKSIFVIMLS